MAEVSSAKRALSPADLDAFRAIVGATNVRTGEAATELDPGWHADNLKSGVVVSPVSTGEVAAIIKHCAVRRIAIITHGGRTGLVGGGVSYQGEIVLSTARMNRIERLDPQERVAVAEAGVPLEILQNEAAKHGLEPGIDLAARGSATIGGMISTNAGGVMAFRSGVMRHRVFGLEAVLPDGSIYDDLTRVVKNTAGYDLKHLLIGAEGTLGVVTRAAIKLEPLPKATATAMLSLPSVEAALATVNHALDASNGQLRAAEVLWRKYLELTAEASGWKDSALDVTQPLFLLLVLGGDDESELQAELQSMFEVAHAKDSNVTGIIASSRRQERELMHLREFTEAIYRKHGPAPSFDVSVPLTAIDTYLARVRRELVAYDPSFDPYCFGHLADGNLHVVVNCEPLPDARMRAVEDILYRDIQQLGGSFSAEHGVGSKRREALSATVSPAKLTMMRAIKAALDPNGIMNPGKVLPA